MSGKSNVLFLCTGNSCRSQMAEGFARHFHSDWLNAYSAGLEAHGLNSYAVEVMQQDGIDISSHHSQRLSELDNIDFDFVITVCDHADEHCPTFSNGAKVIHHRFDDPPKLARSANNKEEAMACYQRVREQIRQYVEGLPEKLI